MKARTLVAIFIRCIALGLFVQLLFMLPTIGRFFSLASDSNRMGEGSPIAHMAVWVFAILFVVVVPSVLFWNAGFVAGLLLTEKDAEIHLSGKVSDDFEICLYRCAGLYAVITYVPNFLNVFVTVITYARSLDPMYSFARRFCSVAIEYNLIYSIAGILLGLFLIFKAPYFYRLVRKFSPTSER